LKRSREMHVAMATQKARKMSNDFAIFVTPKLPARQELNREEEEYLGVKQLESFHHRHRHRHRHPPEETVFATQELIEVLLTVAREMAKGEKRLIG
jgi:hypothetical protein